jgi:hypothetical protein
LAGAKPVAFAVLQDYDKGTPLDSIARDFALIRRLGADTWRGSFGWDDYEPERGVYDFAWLHRFVETAARHGVRLRPYIGYTPAWAANGGSGDGQDWNDPPRSLADWARFVQRLAGELRRHGNVLSYEIYNEENVPMWWDGTAEAYAEVLARAGDALRAAGSPAALVLGGLVWPDPEWIATACGSGDTGSRIAAVPVHAYAETWTPDSVTVERWLEGGYRERFLPAVRDRCGAKPVWINEAGFATANGRSERDQASWWVRAIATFLADSAVQAIGIYQLHDQQPTAEVFGEAENRLLGLVRLDGTPKLAFRTVQLMLRLLNTGRLAVRDEAIAASVVAGRPGRLHHHLFERPDGRRVLVVWDESGHPTVALRIAPAAGVTEFGLDGRAARRPPIARQAIELTPRLPRIVLLQPGG